MFSVELNDQKMTYIRIGLETHAKVSLWWTPRFSRHQRRAAIILERLEYETNQIIKSQRKQQCLFEIKRLINREFPDHDFEYICLYQRTMAQSSDEKLSVNNTLIERIPLTSIQER